MAITKLSNKAFAIVAYCEKTGNPFGITVDPEGNKLKFVWSFKISKGAAHREGYDNNHVRGAITFAPGYPGCPYCRTTNFWVCNNCHSVVCWHGQKVVTCPNCQMTGELYEQEIFDLQGGDY